MSLTKLEHSILSLLIDTKGNCHWHAYAEDHVPAAMSKAVSNLLEVGLIISNLSGAIQITADGVLCQAQGYTEPVSPETDKCLPYEIFVHKGRPAPGTFRFMQITKMFAKTVPEMMAIIEQGDGGERLKNVTVSDPIEFAEKMKSAQY